jgi:hypothetical protein
MVPPKGRVMTVRKHGDASGRHAKLFHSPHFLFSLKNLSDTRGWFESEIIMRRGEAVSDKTLRK